VIIFQKITWRNFLSTGNTPIEINLREHPTTLVIGKNGSGKSTVLDALCFALFNKPYRIIKKDQMINTINNADSMVEVWFSVGPKNYQVRRGIKPNVFEIYEDGVLINQNASGVDYQKYLETNIMKLNYRSFCQVVILGSSSYEPFMKMRASYRRDVIEEILDIKVFASMNILLRGRQQELAKEITTLRHNVDLIENKVELQEQHYNELSKRDTDLISLKQKDIEKAQQDKRDYMFRIESLNKEITKNQLKITDKTKVSTKMTQLQKLEAKIDQNLKTHKKALKFFEENTSCPVCTQEIQSDFRQKKVNEEKEQVLKLQDGYKKLLSEITKHEEKIGELDTVSDRIRNIETNVAKLNTSIDELKRYSDRLEDEIEKLRVEDVSGLNIKEEIAKLKQELVVTKEQRDQVIDDKKYVDVLRQIVDDSGARAQIIKKYLPVMNTLINQYLQSMDFFVSFHLDEEFKETVKSRHMDTFNYNNFSEGEKMRIDLALLFTWRSIAKMKNSVNTNLLILDEIFDSSLDGQGTDDFFKIIKTLTKENIYIISHKGDIMFDKFTNIIKFEKYQNFTRITDV
jgi:DNA repair exonuclease SbcCD ATPase subunit|tara:strand:- start:2290 stop:4005 length:1716 start_codon:yes stop_codon:yes gene_type:complete